MFRREYRRGDAVVYARTKHGRSPGPRARLVSPAPRGDEYVYVVDKLWVVDRLLEDGRLLLRTRRGKVHVVSPDDPHLHRASIPERLRYLGRFPRARRSSA